MDRRLEPPPGPRDHQSSVRIRFADADSAGVMFFANILPHAHAVLEELVTTAGIPWERWFADPDHLIPLRRVEVDYHKPLYPGRTVPAAIGVEKLGRSAVHFAVRFWDGAGRLSNLVRFVCVFVRPADMGIISIPPDIKEKLRPFLAAPTP